MFRQFNRFQKVGELIPFRDPVADAGKALRDRLDALRPHSDLKHWR